MKMLDLAESVRKIIETECSDLQGVIVKTGYGMFFNKVEIRTPDSATPLRDLDKIRKALARRGIESSMRPFSSTPRLVTPPDTEGIAVL
jgi:hypothetical protein